MKKRLTALLVIFLIFSVEIVFLLVFRVKDVETTKVDDDNYTSENADIVDVCKAEYTYREMVEDLNLLNNEYKGKMYLNVIGTTYDNRNIYEVILGNKNAENHVLIHAGIHGREYLNCLLVMKQLEYYLKNYDVGSYKEVPYKTLFEKTAFHIVPMVNPDGITISQSGDSNIINKDLKEGIKECYEKDLQDNSVSASYEEYLKKWKSNARGVDLNRNFNASWESIHQVVHPSFENYKGENYESELETRALVRLTHKYKFNASISYHSSGELIYWDYKDCVDRDACSTLADIAVEVTGYQKGSSDSNYSNVVSGGYKDWSSSDKTNFVPGITIETGKGTCPLKISEFDRLWDKNMYLWAAYSYYLTR